MATIVSKYSDVLQIILALVVNEAISVNANKFVKFGSKNISKTYSDQIKALLGWDGRLDGLDLTVVGTNLTIAPGKFVHKGIVCETTDSTTIQDTGGWIDPYYLYGYIENDATNPFIEFGLTSDTSGDYAILAENNGVSWELETPLELGKLWRDLISHIEDQELHCTTEIDSQISSPSSPGASNPYATKLDLFTYDTTTGRNHIIEMLQNLIELETNSNANVAHKFRFENMFADVIPIENDITPTGKRDTFYESWINGDIGTFGVYNDSGNSIEFETPIIRNIEVLNNHILVSVKSLSVGTIAYPIFDISTNGTTYELIDQSVDDLIDVSTLSKSSNGTYDLKFNFKIPGVSGGDYWTTKQNLTNETAMNAAQFINNRLYSIGGSDDSLSDAGIQEYSTHNDSFTIFMSLLDRRSVPSTKDEFLGKINIFNSLNAAHSLTTDISEIIMSNKSIANVATGISYWGSTSVELATNDSKSIFGTGETGGSYTNSWKSYNNINKALATLTNFPISASGVNSAAALSSGKRVYNYGAQTSSGTQSYFNYYDVVSNAFFTISATEYGSPSTTMKSYGESLEFTPKNSIIVAGIAQGAIGSEIFSSETSEYSIKNNIITKRTNMSINIGHNANCLASNGKIYSLAGRQGNSSPDLSSAHMSEYTSTAVIYMFGWAAEWQ